MKKPDNIILFCIDTLRYDCTDLCPERPLLGRYNMGNRVETPDFSRFCKKGTYFSQAVSQSSYTTSSHATVFTGYYPQKHNVRPFFKWKLRSSASTLAASAREAGYRTIHAAEFPYFGLLGLDEGADEVFAASDKRLPDRLSAHPRGNYLFYHLFDTHFPYGFSELYRKGPVAEQYEHTIRHYGARYRVPVTDPFPFLTGSSQIIEKMWDCGDIDEIFALYIDGVNAFFRNRFREVTGFFAQTGMLENSLLILFSDHGEGPNTAHFGHGGDLFEGIIRVPLYIQWPGVIPEDSINNTQVRLADIYPTVMEAINMRNRIPDDTDGIPLWPLFNGPGGHRPAYSEVWSSTLSEDQNNEHMEQSLKQGDIIASDYSVKLYQRSLRNHPWKIIVNGPEEQVPVDFSADNGEFLRQAYRAVLKRNPDREGFAGWLNQLQSRYMTKTEVLSSLRSTPEFAALNALYDLTADPKEQENVLLSENPARDIIFGQLKDELDALAAPGYHAEKSRTGFSSDQEAKKVREHLEGLGYL